MLTNTALSETVYFKLVDPGEDALSAAKYPASGSFIDVSRYLRWGFLCPFGGLDTATVLQVEQATAVDGSPKDITGATLTVATGGDDNIYGIEVHRDMLDVENGYKFVTLDVTGATGGNDYAAIVFWAIPDSAPAAQETTTNLVILSPAQ